MIYEELKPDQISETLRERLCELENVLKKKKEGYKKNSAERLRIIKKGKTFQFYKIEKGKKSIYLPKKNWNEIKRLAQKSYEKKVVSKLERQIKLLKGTIKKLEIHNIEKVYERASNERKKLISPVTFPEELIKEKWEQIKYTKKEFWNNSTEFFTSKNERVRSKSELIIAECLIKNNILFHYEYPIKINNAVFYPDFCCYNINKRKNIFWEHFGMMDNLEYLNKAIEKIKFYQENNFQIGTDVVFTMESSSVPISSKQIEKVINLYFT